MFSLSLQGREVWNFLQFYRNSLTVDFKPTLDMLFYSRSRDYIYLSIYLFIFYFFLDLWISLISIVHKYIVKNVTIL